MTVDLVLISSQIKIDNLKRVDARQLHSFLEVGREFNPWIKGRIDEYGFVEDLDFTPNRAESTGGRPSTEYSLTLSMAKELCMVETTVVNLLSTNYGENACQRI